MKEYINFKLNTAILMALLLLANIAFGIDTAKLKIIETAGCNLTIVEETATNTYALKLTSDVHNWYAGVFEGLDTKNPTIFTLNMTGTGGDVSKWEGLYPVYTYGKYLNYDTYTYYTKNNDGHWVSSDPFAKDKLAGNGKTPIQTVIPELYAGEFLSEEGKYWSVWKDLTDTKVNVGSNTFTITNQFNSPNASIAMKYPYSYDYGVAYIEKLKQANLPGVTVHNIGKSEKDHDLFIIEVNDPTAAAEELKNRRVVLIYANEDGNEPDGSWVAQGALNFLISGSDEAKKVLKEVTFLIIPIFDVDGSLDSTYAELTDQFTYDDFGYIRPEIIAYTSFIIEWIAVNERNLDIILNLHNVECNEAPNVMCPFRNIVTYAHVNNLNNFILSKLPKNIKSSTGTWIENFSDKRFMDWCQNIWGTLSIPYELNSRYPENRLNLNDLHDLGRDFVLVLYDYFRSDEYERVMPVIEKKKHEQLKKREQFLQDHQEIDQLHIYFTVGAGF